MFISFWTGSNCLLAKLPFFRVKFYPNPKIIYINDCYLEDVSMTTWFTCKTQTFYVKNEKMRNSTQAMNKTEYSLMTIC
jgi:hypothetical protein